MPTVKKVVKTIKPTKSAGLSVPTFSLLGKEAGTLDLPKDIFGAKVNLGLLSQALRVYLNNQKTHFSNTKTRGQVRGSTRKIYRQKGTGGARHGAKRAPIFVGGGIALGPKYRKIILELPKKMKRAALISALSKKTTDNEISGIILDKVSGKTSQIAKLTLALNKKSTLILTDKKDSLLSRGVSNLENVDYLPIDQVSVFEVIKYQSLLLTKEAVEKIQQRLKKAEEE